MIAWLSSVGEGALGQDTAVVGLDNQESRRIFVPVGDKRQEKKKKMQRLFLTYYTVIT